MDWHPNKPTSPQVYFGICLFASLAVVATYWSFTEEDLANRIVLWALGGLFATLAVWRVGVAVRLSRDT